MTYNEFRSVVLKQFGMVEVAFQNGEWHMTAYSKVRGFYVKVDKTEANCSVESYQGNGWGKTLEDAFASAGFVG